MVDEGHAPFSQGYFESLETHLGLRQAEGGEDQQQRTSAAMVSAPVSRQTTSRSNPKPSNGKITLTQEQKEYAKIANKSDVVLAMRCRCEEQGHEYENCCSIALQVYQECKWCGDRR